jgi:hypothetical protein
MFTPVALFVGQKRERPIKVAQLQSVFPSWRLHHRLFNHMMTRILP